MTKAVTVTKSLTSGPHEATDLRQIRDSVTKSAATSATTPRVTAIRDQTQIGAQIRDQSVAKPTTTHVRDKIRPNPRPSVINVQSTTKLTESMTESTTESRIFAESVINP